MGIMIRGLTRALYEWLAHVFGERNLTSPKRKRVNSRKAGTRLRFGLVSSARNPIEKRSSSQ
jgi:hypothetical protein